MKKVCNIYNAAAHYRKSIYQLLDSSFECKFVFGDEAPSVKRFDTTVLKSCSFLHYHNVGKICILPGMIKYIFQKYDYYIITPETNNATMWLFLLLVRLIPTKKVFAWSHGMYGNENKRQLLLKKFLYHLCDGEFVYGNYAINLMKEKGFDGQRLYPIHNSLDYDAQMLLRNSNLTSDVYSSKFDNNNYTIVSIGRLNIRKRLDLLLDAVFMLNQKGLSCNVVIIGEGEELNNLRNKAKKMGLESQTWFYGACFDEATNAELLYNSDLCVIPGDVGLTAIHAMMFGVPVITHDYFPSQGPEFEVIHEGVTGMYYRNNDVKSLAKVIEKWLVENKDKRNIVRSACYEVVDKEWNPYYQIQVFRQVLK